MISFVPSSSRLKFPIQRLVSYDSFFRGHRVFLSSIVSVKEPDTFAEAASQKCRQPAIQEEIDALQHNLGLHAQSEI